MQRSKAIAKDHQVDGRTIHTQSIDEATTIKRLVKKHGFSNKWAQSNIGIAHGFANYTPDFELCVSIGGESTRAIVEQKSHSVIEFKKKDRRRMVASSHYYDGCVCYIYISRKDTWHQIDHEGRLKLIPAPIPGAIDFSLLPRPNVYIILPGFSWHWYKHRPITLTFSILIKVLEFALSLIFGDQKSYRTTRRNRKKF